MKLKQHAGDAERHQRQLEKDNEDLKNNLADSITELEIASTTSRSHYNELTKYKHQHEQLAEQLNAVQKEKRRLIG